MLGALCLDGEGLLDRARRCWVPFRMKFWIGFYVDLVCGGQRDVQYKEFATPVQFPSGLDGRVHKLRKSKLFLSGDYAVNMSTYRWRHCFIDLSTSRSRSCNHCYC